MMTKQTPRFSSRDRGPGGHAGRHFRPGACRRPAGDGAGAASAGARHDQHGQLRHRAVSGSRARHGGRVPAVTSKKASTPRPCSTGSSRAFWCRAAASRRPMKSSSPPMGRSPTNPAMACRTSAAGWAWRAPRRRTAATASSSSTWRTIRSWIPLPVRWGYAVFGKVIDGMDVSTRSAPCPPAPRASSKPMLR